MLSDDANIFVIPLREVGRAVLPGTVISDRDLEVHLSTNGPGPYAVRVVGDESVVEIACMDNHLYSAVIPTGPRAKWCRATTSALEETASAGLMIYDEAETIYKEAYASTGMERPPFYTADVTELRKWMRDHKTTFDSIPKNSETNDWEARSELSAMLESVLTYHE